MQAWQDTAVAVSLVTSDDARFIMGKDCKGDGGYLVLWALTEHTATAISYGSWQSYATDVNGIY